LVGCGKLDRASERGGLPLSRERSLSAPATTRGLHASAGFERLLVARTVAAGGPDRIKAPHRVMSQVGHADSKMTMDVYAQLEQRVDRSHGESFDRLVRKAREQVAGYSPDPADTPAPSGRG